MRRALRWAAAIALDIVGACAGIAWVWTFWFFADADGFLQSGFYAEECGWIEGNGVGGWMGIGVFQVGLLAIAIAALTVASWVAPSAARSGRGGEPQRGRRGRWSRSAGVWAAGVAVTALIDLTIYVFVWVSWARCREESWGSGPFAFPTRQVVEGSLAALAVAAAAVALAVILVRRGRRQHAAPPVT